MYWWFFPSERLIARLHPHELVDPHAGQNVPKRIDPTRVRDDKSIILFHRKVKHDKK
jgi:hypothetical protein